MRRALYPRSEDSYIIVENVANRLGLGLADAKAAAKRLMHEGFLGPGEPFEKDREVFVAGKLLTWDGSSWVVRPRHAVIMRRDGRIWRTPPKRLRERAERKAERKAVRVEWDGLTYPVLTDRDPYVAFGRMAGLFGPVTSRCARCGTELEVQFGKKPRHDVAKCDEAIVREVMGS